MRFASLGSGSKGNGTLVEAGASLVLIDCGFSVRDTERRLARLGCSGNDLSAILVTHEHSDHIRGVLPLARKYSLPVLMTKGTASAAKMEDYSGLQLIIPQQPVQCAGLSLLPVVVPHDARDPVQFVVSYRQHKVGVLTDLGTVSANVVECFNGCDGLLLEANHDPEMLRFGSYPPYLKQRVGGEWGHLSNLQAASLLSRIEKRKIQSLVLGHISLQNNSTALVAEAVKTSVNDVGNVLFACQEQGFGWQVVE